jgi:flagellar protein FliO/FliZ
MTWMSRILAVLALSTVAVTSTVAKANSSLTGITTKRIGSDFFVELNFSGIISENDVRLNYEPTGINISVAGVRSSQKQIRVVKDSTVDRVFASNGADGDIKLQIKVAKALSGLQFEKSTTFVTQTNQLLIRVGEPALAAAAAAAAGAMPGALIDKLMKQESEKSSSTASGATTEVRQAGSTASDEASPVFKNPTPEVKAKTTTTAGLVGRMLLSLSIVAGVFGAGLYGLRKWPGTKKLTSRSKMIEVLAQHSLGPKKSVAVIRVAGEAVLVGVTDNHVSILKSLALLDDDKFQSALQNTVAKSVQSEAGEDFSMRGLKEIVHDRLKNMKSLG